MSFGETLYYKMYELLSPYGMESSDADRNKWAMFPFGDLTEDDKAVIQAAFEGVLQEIVAYLRENGVTIADLMENGAWKGGNEGFIGLLSKLAESIGSTYDSTVGTLVFSADGSTTNGVFPFVAVKAAAVATDKTYLVNGSTLSAIGDAIRAKEGTTEKYSPATMAQKITDDLVKPSGTIQIKSAQQVDVSSYQYAKVTDANLTAGNIKKDVTILGITGTHEGGGGSVSPTIDGIMQANGYTMGSKNIVEDQINGFKAMLDDVVTQIEGESGYSTNHEIVPYFNDAENKIAFVIQ